MKRFFIFCLSLPLFMDAQFAPAAGVPGTSAIKKDSSSIINWANECRIIRGLQDISNPGSGYASYGDSTKSIGPADGSNVVSLGDGGSALLTFPQPIKNGSGPDFCVFENTFDPNYLELAFVEVSSDGINYTRFPATCNVQNTIQIGPFDTSSDPTKINNLAGKYIANYGVPFDLQELQGTAGLDIDHITHVKLIDVVGCIQPAYARYDKNNNIINDLWSTPYPTGGFDLDAVGVIHQAPVGLEEVTSSQSIGIYRNGEDITVWSTEPGLLVSCRDMSGRELMLLRDSGHTVIFPIGSFSSGIYVLQVSNEKGSRTSKIIR